MSSHSLKVFSETCEAVKSTTKKREKVDIISRYFSSLDEETLPIVCRFLSGYIFPKWSGREVYAGYSTLIDLILEITSSKRQDFESTYLKHGDLGSTAEVLLANRRMIPLITRNLNIIDVYSTFERMASLTGSGAAGERSSLLKGLMLNCEPIEAKYLIKVLTRELRIGLEEGLVEEGLAKAFGRRLEDVRAAHLVSGDIGITALLASKDRLSEARLEMMHPTNFMLADTMQTVSEIEEYYRREVLAEYKYDGVRVQVHKEGANAKIFSRRLDDLSSSFPEVIDEVGAIPHSFILDGEIIPFKEGNPLPFQELQHRLRRKGFDLALAQMVPVALFVYDILCLDGATLIKEPLVERRRLLDSLGFKGLVQSSHIKRVTTAEEIQSFFDESRSLGYEGLVVKDPQSPYTPGKRGRHWVKLKKELDTLDTVVVVAEYGHGKRVGVLSDYTFAVKDGDRLRVIGKAYSGLTDVEILEMTERLLPMTVEDQGYRRLVKPEIVLEVAFDSIQKSDRHDSGYALRFPRIKRIRSDKRVEDIDTLERVKEIYSRQTIKRV